ncbi:MAG: gallidermin/nisin family lantibiotic [Parachlamydiaceae bacterium]|nr:MAG: gallidermin/nisin family lantibiotic [Parachlamydiaceae bacterium]
MSNFIIRNTDSSDEVKRVSKVQTAQVDSADPFDIDIKTVEFKPEVPMTEIVTSKSLCTPGCGNTGTGNSFCC